MNLSPSSQIKFGQFVEFLDLRLRILDEKTPSGTTNTAVRGAAPAAPMTAPTTQPTRGRRNRGRQWSPRRVTSPPPSSSTPILPASPLACLCCSASHRLDACSRFRLLPAQDKAEIVRKNGLCFSCLEAGHTSRSCARTNACATCKGQHHSLLHEWSTASVNARLQSNAAAI